MADNIGAILKANSDKEFKIIVNKSTVPVGTAQKVSNEISKHGVNNFDVVSNPEFLREGFAVEDFMKPDRIVIGASNENSFKTMRRIYEPFVRQGNPILEMDTASAEVTKYAANSYLAMRITYMNQLANYCEKAGANIDLVRRGMGTDNRIGRRFLFAGIGYGGSCFPKDVNALIKTSIESESEMTLLSEVNRVNKLQKLVLVTKVLDYYKGDIDGKTFGVWGLAFKPNTDDMREAPSVVIINEILKYGAKVKAYDPAAMEAARFDLKDTIEYCPDEFAALEGSDALLIFTEWNEFRNPPLAEIKSKIKDNVIFDGRNLFTPEQMKQHGINYFSIGRKPVLI